VNFATHKRFTIAHEHPVAKSAGDEHAAAGEPKRHSDTLAEPQSVNYPTNQVASQ
jgi:hypothetical protein